MSSSVLYMSMSVDGYIAGPHDTPENPGGDGFMRLHEWFGFASEPGPGAGLDDQSGPATSSTKSGNGCSPVGPKHSGADRPLGWPTPRRADLRGQPPAAGTLGGAIPARDLRPDGIASAMAQAKVAAGEQCAGARRTTAQTALAEGVLDELQIPRSRCCSAAGAGCSTCCPNGWTRGRPGDRHAGRHPHPLPGGALSGRAVASGSPAAERRRTPASSACTTPCWRWGASSGPSCPSGHSRAPYRRRPRLSGGGPGP